MELSRLLVTGMDYCREGFLTHLVPLALSRIHCDIVDGHQLKALHVPGSGICAFTYVLPPMLILGNYH